MPDPIDGLNEILSDRYRVERELGEGGMATVYLADDLRHERKVALKVLKPELAAVVGAERFLAEIRTTANLQHPHILPLFDSGEADGFLYYVMPYVEGESLRERLEREKQLPVGDAVAIATKVAGALQAAHEEAVVHRDVKPANILLDRRGEPLVADFGIALAVQEAGGGRLTETGLSLGTPYYMSPEQATADRDPDARSDVYSLGCVVYEMLTGEPPFNAPTAQAVLARILTADPEPITATRRTVPPHVEAAVARALEKLPADRFGSARAFREALDDASFRHTVRALGAPSARPADAGTPSGRGSHRLSRIAAGALAVLLVLAAGWALGSRGTTAPADARVLRVPVDMRGLELNPWEGIVLSPDGSAMAVAASRGDGPTSIRARRADEATFRALSGTEGCGGPSFSPDGEWIAFIGDDGALHKVSVRGGQPTTLVSASVEPSASTHWGDDGMIVFIGGEGLYEVSENGGQPTLLIEDRTLRFGSLHRLPGGRGILGSSDLSGGVWLYEPGADSLRTLVAEGADPMYLPSGHLAYRHREGGLWAAPFDLDALGLTGPARPVLDDLDGTYSVAEGGTLVYTTGDPGAEPVRIVLVPLDGASPDTLPLAPGNMSQAAFSPDGGRIALTVRDGIRPDIFVYDMDLGGPTQFTFGRFGSRDPVWSPDGTRIAFHTSDSGDAFSDTDVWVKPLDGSTPAAPVITEDGVDLLGDWTPEDLLLYWRPVAGGGIRFRPLHDESGDEPFLDVEWRQWQPRLSPDGAWLAYVADPSGQGGVYVRRFPDGTGQQRVSDGEAYDPRWSPSGDVIYYRGEGETIVAARVRLEPTFAVLERRVVYEGLFRNYDVHPTEPRLLLMTPAPEVPGSESDADPQRWFIVTNRFTELRERLGEAN